MINFEKSALEPGLLVGARDWLHQNWNTQFYPEDMPPDWRLSFYSNEFRVVLIDQAMVLQAKEEVEDWADEVDEDFRFLIELTTVADWQSCLALLAPIQAQVAGIILSLPAHDSDEYQKIINAVRKISVPCFNINVFSADESHINEDLDCGIYWSIDESPKSSACNTVSITVVDKSQQIEPLEMRNIIEKCLSKSINAKSRFLIFGGDNPDVDTLRQAVMMRDMIE